MKRNALTLLTATLLLCTFVAPLVACQSGGNISEQSINESSALIEVNSKSNKDKTAITDLTVEVPNIETLNKVLKGLKKIDSVYDVRRPTMKSQ